MEIIEPKALTVSELTRQIKSAVEGRPEFQSVYVRGEVSNLTRHSSGHAYFSLKDGGSQIRAVMFSRYVQQAGAGLRDGMEVFALGSISVYEKRGEYQIVVTAMRPAGVGALHLQFEELKRKLQAEGLFDAARKMPIPAMPSRIAVVTSPTGAAVRDVINVVTRRYPAVELTVVPALVQGEGAPESVRRALASAAALDGVDVILLVRGGGSIEDLWAFNDELLARDIAACRIPIISGVGHETDFTIADFAADLRAPTPSAAAERAVPELRRLEQDLSTRAGMLRRELARKLEVEKSRLRACSVQLAPGRLLDRINQMRQAVDDTMRTAGIRIRHRAEKERLALEALTGQLNALDPYAVLKRGYSVMRDAATGKIVTSVEQAAPGKELEAALADGTLRAVVVDRQHREPLKRRSGKSPGPVTTELDF